MVERGSSCNTVAIIVRKGEVKGSLVDYRVMFLQLGNANNH